MKALKNGKTAIDDVFNSKNGHGGCHYRVVVLIGFYIEILVAPFTRVIIAIRICGTLWSYLYANNGGKYMTPEFKESMLGLQCLCTQ